MTADEIKEKYKALIEKALSIMDSTNDYVHGRQHIEGVVNNVIELLDNQPLADKEVCILSAYWHDVGRKYGKQGHGPKGAEMLKEELIKNNFDDEFINKCYGAIYMHESKEKLETIEEIVVRDADKIDALGVNRWRECVENNVRMPRIVPHLHEILTLDQSKEIYKKRADELLNYLKTVFL